MRIGLFFGTFNPIHIGHIIIGNYMVENTDLEQVWFVVTPHNPLKKKLGLLDDYQRLEMVHRALSPYDKLRPSDIEFKLPQPNFTTHTLLKLEEKYSGHQFSLIVGGDNLRTFQKWKNYHHILDNYKLYVYPRPGIEKGLPEVLTHPGVIITDAPLIDISATLIRQQIKAGKNVRAFMPLEAWQYMDEMNFYK